MLGARHPNRPLASAAGTPQLSEHRRTEDFLETLAKPLVAQTARPGKTDGFVKISAFNFISAINLSFKSNSYRYYQKSQEEKIFWPSFKRLAKAQMSSSA